MKDTLTQPLDFDSPSCLRARRPRARKSDPATSHAAAVAAEVFATSHRAKIMYVFNAPMTIKDLSAACGLDHVAIARRMPDLEELGMCSPTAEVRQRCRVWALTEKGLQWKQTPNAPI